MIEPDALTNADAAADLAGTPRPDAPEDALFFDPADLARWGEAKGIDQSTNQDTTP